MVGIAELFAEYDGSDRDDFQMAFWFERQHEAQIARSTDSKREWRLRATTEQRAQVRARDAESHRQRYATKKQDPAWLEKRRATWRAARAAYRAKQKGKAA